MTKLSGQLRAQAVIKDIKCGSSDVPTRAETNEGFQALSKVQEGQLAYWAIGQARLGFAPALTKFRMLVLKRGTWEERIRR
ncbi:hypothetical protein F4861DRAFT_544639 [Xylaria intraflava]|nr:hypothetical protein F4861DRAFT_544639 [Xylaria intraflava]